jgi:hypothetical protein
MSDQPLLFSKEDLPFNWEEEWQGMPEFRMGNTEPAQKIIVNFASQGDVERFAALIEQNLTPRTNTLWFPKPENYIAPKNFRYVDES